MTLPLDAPDVQVRVYVTDDGTQNGTSPTAFVDGRLPDLMPEHPHALRWRYWGLVNDEDPMVAALDGAARRAIDLQGFHVSHQGVEASGPRR